jgi:Subtilase family
MQLESTDIYADMDPRLQVAAERESRGMTLLATTSSDANEIGVVALVSEPSAWEALSTVRPGATLGQTGKGWIVTGRIPVDQIENVRKEGPVRSMKAAQPLHPLLGATVPEIGGGAGLPPGLQSTGGAGAVAGFVDSGADFAHRHFRNSDGSTRISALWDQSAPLGGNSPFGYGRRYDAAEIHAALQDADPYGTLGYEPPPDRPPREGTHGTHVMDIAAGNGADGQNPMGVAPEADIIFVDPALSDIAWSGEDVVNTEFGDSVQLLEALQFIFQEAGARPCVVNISLGTNGGPHDGSSLVEQGIDSLVDGGANRAVVIAASNSFDDGIHAAGQVPQGGTADVSWQIPDQVVGQSELELWYSGADTFELELLDPDGNALGNVPLGSNARVQDDNGRTLLFVSHRAGDPNNGDNVIGMFLEQRIPSGTWTLRLHGTTVSGDGGYHAWIERNDPSQSSFAEPHDNTHTLGSISCGQKSIVVGSYDAHKPETPLSWFSSAGPTRDGRDKPELSAPGHDVVAARSRTGTGLTRKSGTSMAAPAVTGVVALLLAEASARGQQLDVDTIRSLLIDTARSNPPQAGAWDDRYGSGRVSASGSISGLDPAGGAAGGG